MKASEDHKKYLDQDFDVTPRKLFDPEEIRILEQFGRWMLALMLREIRPETDAQARFLEVCEGKSEPETKFEKVWMKYVARKRWERDNPEYVGASGVREASPGWAGHYRAEFQNGGYLLSRKKYED